MAVIWVDDETEASRQGSPDSRSEVDNRNNHPLQRETSTSEMAGKEETNDTSKGLFGESRR